MTFFLNGLKTEGAVLPLEDPAVEFGRVVFETFRTYELSTIFAQEEHLDRLLASAEMLALDLSPVKAKFPATPLRDVLRKALQEAVNHTAPKQDLRIKLSLSEHNFWIKVQDLAPAQESWYEKGVEIIDAEFERPFAEAKYTSWVYPYFAQKQPTDVFETIFFDRDKNLREGNISNVFGVFGNIIATSDKNILKGVTRSHVIECAQEAGFQLQLREVSWAELLKADEIFLTNTSKEVLPVGKWGSWTRSVFPVAKTLRTYFNKNNE